MPHETAIDIVRRYHQGWTSKNFEQAIDLLAADLEIEVPINDYPTKASFAEALRGFGATVTDVALLSELSNGDEAMLLYDLRAEPLGSLRVAEHFTIADGKIIRLRQIHDTAPVRAAGLAQTTDSHHSNPIPPRAPIRSNGS